MRRKERATLRSALCTALCAIACAALLQGCATASAGQHDGFAAEPSDVAMAVEREVDDPAPAQPEEPEQAAGQPEDEWTMSADTWTDAWTDEWTAPTCNAYGNDFMHEGVRVGEDGTEYTWYSSNTARHWRTGEWTVDEDGFYRDADGYYVVATDGAAEGDVVDTPWGEGRVYDGGCGSAVDMYTAF